ncbi:MAG: hypothetical protein HY360_09890 [Verrucomicrobia bacterium]|nr:hypothetical protein [Verrucomicrobiota bacterium]
MGTTEHLSAKQPSWSHDWLVHFWKMVVSGCLLPWTGSLAAGQASPAQGWEWDFPAHIATAVCTQFPWVSDLPMTGETVRLLRRCALDGLGLPAARMDHWSNGSADEFVAWLNDLAKKGTLDCTLILYFSTHQQSDGRLKFTTGPDLSANRMVHVVNAAAVNFNRLLLINDSCYAAALEKGGSFSDKVIRLYASTERETSRDLDFDRGPAGLEDFAANERRFLRTRLQWEPRGMSFLGLMGLKWALRLMEKNDEGVDLQTLVCEMIRCRDLYNEDVRQARAQHPVLAPANANFTLVRRARSSAAP